MRQRLISIVAALCCLAPITSYARSDPQEDLGAWYMYMGFNRLSDRFGIHTEAQIRYWQVANNLNQVLLRTGLNIHLDPQHILTPGYAYILSDPYESGPQSHEHRIFEQYIQRNSASIFTFEHRFRIEQRWITINDETNFKGRGRYRFLMNTRLGETPWFVSFYNEVFLNFTSEPFDQNRLYAALAHQLSGGSNVQIGYLMNTFKNQNFHRLQLMLILNTDLR